MHNIILKMTCDRYYNKLCYIGTNIKSKILLHIVYVELKYHCCHLC